MVAGEMKDLSFANSASSYDKGLMGRASRTFYNLIHQEIEISPGDRVLDVGCGTGALLNRLASTAEFFGYGVDVEKKMIEQAKNNTTQMEFSIARCDALPFADQCFDIVVACLAYHHFDNREGFATEVARVLKPGGVLYLAGPRFPLPFRKALNGLFKLLGIVGRFYTAKEIAAGFQGVGFACIGVGTDRYAQVVKLQRSPTE